MASKDDVRKKLEALAQYETIVDVLDNEDARLRELGKKEEEGQKVRGLLKKLKK